MIHRMVLGVALLVWVGCVTSTARLDSGPAGMTNLRIAPGEKLPDVRFADELGEPVGLMDFMRGGPVMLVFISDMDEHLLGHVMSLRESASARAVLVVQLAYRREDHGPQADLPDRGTGGEPTAFLCDPRGIVRRELGLGKTDLFVAVDAKGVVRAIGRLDDRGAVTRATKEIALKR